MLSSVCSSSLLRLLFQSLSHIGVGVGWGSPWFGLQFSSELRQSSVWFSVLQHFPEISQPEWVQLWEKEQVLASDG